MNNFRMLNFTVFRYYSDNAACLMFIINVQPIQYSLKSSPHSRRGLPLRPQKVQQFERER